MSSGWQGAIPAGVLLAFLPGCTAPASSPPSRSAGGPVPLLVLIERDPWLMVIGSDSPTFALYQDGSVIMVDPDAPPGGGWKRYLSLKLSPSALQDFLGKARLDSLWALKEDYEITGSTDMPTNEIHVWKGGQRKTTTVYGPLRKVPEGMRPKSPPPDFERVFKILTSFRSPESVPWLPARIEVLLWPFEYSQLEPAEWPPHWPTLDQAETLHDSARRIYLPRSELSRLQALIRSLGERQAVLLAGQKWSIAYRIPFPSESAWMPDPNEEG